MNGYDVSFCNDILRSELAIREDSAVERDKLLKFLQTLSLGKAEESNRNVGSDELVGKG